MLVVIALLLDTRQNQVLLSLRPKHKDHGGLWELPGGKVEVDETLWQALSRELQEELGICPSQGKLISELQYSYTHYSVELKTFSVNDWQGQVYGSEGQICRWVAYSELGQYAMPSGTCQVLKDIGLVS